MRVINNNSQLCPRKNIFCDKTKRALNELLISDLFSYQNQRENRQSCLELEVILNHDPPVAFGVGSLKQ